MEEAPTPVAVRIEQFAAAPSRAPRLVHESAGDSLDRFSGEMTDDSVEGDALHAYVRSYGTKKRSWTNSSSRKGPRWSMSADQFCFRANWPTPTVCRR